MALGWNGGHLQPLLFDRTPSIARFELANCNEVASYIKSNNVPCEYRAVSGCRTFWTEPDLAKALSDVEALKKEAPDIGSKVTVVTTPSELSEHRVQSSCPGATLTEGAASLWPYKLVTFIIRKLVESGKINLQTKTPVRSIKPTSSGLWTLQTPRGNLTAPHVILATNAYTSHLLSGFESLIAPCRGTMTALLPPPGSTEILPNSYGMVGYQPHATADSDDYLIQRPFSSVPNPKGHLMFGGGRYEGSLPAMGESDDSIIDQDTVTYLKKILLATLRLSGETEGLAELRAEYSWSGIMGYSRDNAPWVGNVPGQPGLWISAGYTGHGMPNATLCARAVVEMLLASKAGGDLDAVVEDMIAAGRIPEAYVISEKRIKNASSLPTLQEQDEKGCMGYEDGKWVVVN